MKVLLLLVSASQHMSGVQRHALDLAAALVKHTDVEAVHLAASPWQRDLLSRHLPPSERLHLHFPPIGRSSLERNLWYYLRLPALAAKLQVDLVHLTYPMPLRRGAMPCPTLVTLHDLYPFDTPENFTFPHVLANRWALSQCLGTADAIACVSRTTCRQLQRHYTAAIAARTSVIPNIVREASCAENASERRGHRVLCVAQHRANKNITLALATFRLLLYRSYIPPLTRFVLVGIPGPETKRIEQFIASSALENHVDLLTGINDDELDTLYRTSELVLAPSSVEGFGLPVVEALRCGARVVCSDIPAFREFGDGHCSFVPLGSGAEEAFLRASVEALKHPKPAPVVFPTLLPDAVAQRWQALYRSLLAHSSSSVAAVSVAVKKGLPLL